MAQTWVHLGAEACRGSWDKELASPGLASEVVITGLEAPERIEVCPWAMGKSGVCPILCVLEWRLGNGEGRSQLLVRPNLNLLMTLKVDKCSSLC